MMNPSRLNLARSIYMARMAANKFGFDSIIAQEKANKLPLFSNNANRLLTDASSSSSNKLDRGGKRAPRFLVLCFASIVRPHCLAPPCLGLVDSILARNLSPSFFAPKGIGISAKAKADVAPTWANERFLGQAAAAALNELHNNHAGQSAGR